MVLFNELKFSDDLKTLIIDCGIENADAEEENEGFFISAIYLEHYSIRNVTGAPSDWAKEHPLYVDEGDYPTSKSLEIPISFLVSEQAPVTTFEKGLFYVIVECTRFDNEEPLGSTDDPEDYMTVINEFGAVLDWQYVHELGMKAVANYVFQYGKNSCDVPAELEQFTIVWHSLDLAIETKDLDMLDLLWRRFVGYSVVSKPCNCS